MMKMIKRHGFLFVEAPANVGPVVVADPPKGALELADFLGTHVDRIMNVSERAAAIEDEQEIAAALAEEAMSDEQRAMSLEDGADEAMSNDEQEGRSEDCGVRAGLATTEYGNTEGVEDFGRNVAGGVGQAEEMGPTQGNEGEEGARRQRKIGKIEKGAAARKANYDPAVWGDLAGLSDEDPTSAVAIAAKKTTAETQAEAAPRLENFEMANDRVVRAIQERVMALFKVKRERFFKSRTSVGRAAAARVASMALCRKHTRLTLEEIGAAHGRDHGQVSRAAARFEEIRAEDERFAALVAEVDAGILALAA